MSSLISEERNWAQDNRFGLEKLLEKLDILAKRKRGRLRVGADEVFAVTLSLSDDDFAKLVSGQTQAQRLFMSGKLKIKGDVMKVGPTS